MEGGKKGIAIVALLIVIVGVVGMLVKKHAGEPEPPIRVTGMEIERIDTTDGTLHTQTLKEWENAGKKDGKYKSPKSGDYTMVTPHKCVACGEKVIPAEFPASLEGRDIGRVPDGDEIRADAEARDKIRREYKCPKCSEPAYPDPDG